MLICKLGVWYVRERDVLTPLMQWVRGFLKLYIFNIAVLLLLRFESYSPLMVIVP